VVQVKKLFFILLTIFGLSIVIFFSVVLAQPPAGGPIPVDDPSLLISGSSVLASGVSSAGAIVRERIIRIKPVLLGASLPQQVSPGDKFTACFVAYNKQLEKGVKNSLESLSPRSRVHMDLKRCRWPIDTSVKVQFYGDYLIVKKDVREFVWDGAKSIIDFDVEVSPQAPESTIVAKFDLSIDEILVATLRMDLQIASQKSSNEITKVVNICPAETAFASYSSKDRQRVLDRVDAIKICGIDVFLDCLSINPGEKWKNRLEREINSRDIFILFWSKNAQDSKEVSWEWHTALKDKGAESIQVQPLQPTFEAPPPEELKGLHFGSACMLALKAYETSNPPPDSQANKRF
jgi:hypothetical protein